MILNLLNFNAIQTPRSRIPLLKRNIIQLAPETDAQEYAQHESKLIAEKTPYYIQHQLYAGDLTRGDK